MIGLRSFLYVLCFGFGIVASAGGFARASDLPAPAPVPARAPGVITASDLLYNPERIELRAGGYYHCCLQESGSGAVGIEVVAPRFFHFAALPDFFSPRVHVGGVIDTGGHTSYGYAGLLFTHYFTRNIFFEPFVGVAVSDGKALGDANHNAIGCTTLIHSGANLGYRFDQRWSVMATLDHISNANLCSRNLGVNNYGLKIGYTF